MAISKAGWNQSSRHLDRPLSQLSSSPLWKITRWSIFALRCGLILLLLLYVLIAIYYLTTDGSTVYSKRDAVHPFSNRRFRQTSKNVHANTNTFDAPERHISNSADITDDIVYNTIKSVKLLALDDGTLVQIKGRSYSAFIGN